MEQDPVNSEKNGLGIDEIKDAEPIEEYREFFSIEY